jgi:hypothetical protein
LLIEGVRGDIGPARPRDGSGVRIYPDPAKQRIIRQGIERRSPQQRFEIDVADLSRLEGEANDTLV